MSIWQHIADDSIKNAHSWHTVIKKTLILLAENPLIGKLRTDLAENIRSFPIGNYVIIYIPIPDGIRVFRIFHGARDIQSIWQS